MHRIEADSRMNAEHADQWETKLLGGINALTSCCPRRSTFGQLDSIQRYHLMICWKSCSSFDDNQASLRSP
jgi:hypothetical protein